MNKGDLIEINSSYCMAHMVYLEYELIIEGITHILIETLEPGSLCIVLSLLKDMCYIYSFANSKTYRLKPKMFVFYRDNDRIKILE